MPRESKYRPDFPQQAKKLCMLLGATNEALAKFFDVSTSTIDNWLADPDKAEFAEAVRFGRDFADAEVAFSTYQRAVGYSHPETKVHFYVDKEGKPAHYEVTITKHYPPDTGAAAFWLKNRQGWRDKVELTGGGPGGALELFVVYEDEEPPEDPDEKSAESDG